MICETLTKVRLNFIDNKGDWRATSLVMHRGVPQCSPLSESLFILTTADAVRKVESNDNAKIRSVGGRPVKLGGLAIADDQLIIAQTLRGAEDAVEKYIEDTEKIGLVMNKSKTNAFVLRRAPGKTV